MDDSTIVDVSDEDEFISIGSRVREKESRDKSHPNKRREGTVFADSSVNGARILNVKWDNGTKDFMDEGSVEIVGSVTKKKKRSLFSILSKSPSSASVSSESSSPLKDDKKVSGIHSPNSVSSPPSIDQQQSDDEEDEEEGAERAVIGKNDDGTNIYAPKPIKVTRAYGDLKEPITMNVVLEPGKYLIQYLASHPT